MKIFELIYTDDEKQWVAAMTNMDALKEVLKTEDADIDFIENIIELPESKWDEYVVKNTDYDSDDSEDWETMTFRKFLETECSTAKIISSTFYSL